MPAGGDGGLHLLRASALASRAPGPSARGNTLAASLLRLEGIRTDDPSFALPLSRLRGHGRSGVLPSGTGQDVPFPTLMMRRTWQLDPCDRGPEFKPSAPIHRRLRRWSDLDVVGDPVRFGCQSIIDGAATVVRFRRNPSDNRPIFLLSNGTDAVDQSIRGSCSTCIRRNEDVIQIATSRSRKRPRKGPVMCEPN